MKFNDTDPRCVHIRSAFHRRASSWFTWISNWTLIEILIIFHFKTKTKSLNVAAIWIIHESNKAETDLIDKYRDCPHKCIYRTMEWEFVLCKRSGWRIIAIIKTHSGWNNIICSVSKVDRIIVLTKFDIFSSDYLQCFSFRHDSKWLEAFEHLSVLSITICNFMQSGPCFMLCVIYKQLFRIHNYQSINFTPSVYSRYVFFFCVWENTFWHT